MNTDTLKLLFPEDPRKAWHTLVKRYAGGRTICNCGEAYLSPCGHGRDKDGRRRTDLPACSGGCSANIITARNEIAKRVLADLEKHESVKP